MKAVLTSATVVLVCAILTLGVWAGFNRPVMEPLWPTTLQGIAFSPFHADDDGIRGIYPDIEQIEADLALLSGKTHAVRTYSNEGVFYQIPRLAAKHKLNVTVGAWIDRRLDNNEEQIKRAIELSRYRNVVRVIVGNEVLLRNDVSPASLITYLDRVREHSQRPVSTAETWSTWMKYPELAEHVDFIAVHILPYWEGVDIDEAIAFVVEKMDLLQRTFPGKPVVIAEVGWPSEGRTRYQAVASESNQAVFLRRFFSIAAEKDYIYYVMEAFDQPWKIQIEGAVGAYWGIYNVDRQPKFPFFEPIVSVPEWKILAAISVAAGAMLLLLLYYTSHTINTAGKTFLAVNVFGLVTATTWIIHDYLDQYMTPIAILIGVVLLLSMLGIIILLLAEAHEWTEAYWISRHRRSGIPKSVGACPMVSIHVPACNEPPDMLIETLKALSVLDYADYEVIVVDNNTRDEAVWRPVENWCRLAGEKFRFYHVDPLSGYKAGALNYALQHTSPAAEILACIDSDYIVDRSWLKDLAPAFADERIYIVQAPQDYRDAEESAFKAMCYAEYRGFFHIGMVTRNDRNAIIQHGTMTMVRRAALEGSGGWAEWCITEDAELGLRILEQGHEAVYTSRSYGKGLMPDTFMDYKKQRHRWAFGAVQIMKRHAGALLLPRGSRLSAGQRYHFIAGWLPWLADSVNLVFSLFAIMWSVGMMYAPQTFEVPLMIFSVLPITYFVFKVAKLFHLYRRKMGASLAQTLAAATVGLSLSHTIGHAMLHGLFTSNQPFFRTPKCTHHHRIASAVTSAYEETLMLTAFVLAIVSLSVMPVVDSPDYSLWLIMLGIQGLPYAAALVTSMVSVFPVPAWLIGKIAENNTNYATES